MVAAFDGCDVTEAPLVPVTITRNFVEPGVTEATLIVVVPALETTTPAAAYEAPSGDAADQDENGLTDFSTEKLNGSPVPVGSARATVALPVVVGVATGATA